LTVENYVKSIALIAARDKGKHPVVGTGELAQALNVSPGTVTGMLKTLSEANLATYTPYEGARLTPSGERLAMKVIRRHRLLELFLVQTLSMPWDEVHEEA
jgi:DtxR family Mn-dependent transcriptional regulator